MLTLVAALSDYAVCNEGLYWDGGLCVTAQECEDMQQYAYKTILMCISIGPKEGAENVPGRTEDYEYVCPTGYYLFVDKSGTECLRIRLSPTNFTLRRKNRVRERRVQLHGIHGLLRVRRGQKAMS